MDPKARILIAFLSICLLFLILNLIRRKRLKEEYALLWLITGVILVLVPLFSDYIDQVAHFFGVYYEPGLIFAIAILCLLVILFHYSVIISKLTEQNKVLIQDLALLRKKLEDLEAKLSNTN
ncbi:hypothetical protein DRQ15_01390 [candidate division KSB1 bacterium]|nr:MAG: hypothetical protein DRQ12_09535 [candidate division KSB1 bacterium]RKY92768.1 MAG: hypothetical protein DRQ15_01390 [candidate division KSB1 bacterium]